MSYIRYCFERKLNKKNLLMFIVALLFRSISWGEEEERQKERGTTSCILSGWLIKLNPYYTLKTSDFLICNVSVVTDS